jgi:hypothetical protein
MQFSNLARKYPLCLDAHYCVFIPWGIGNGIHFARRVDAFTTSRRTMNWSLAKFQALPELGQLFPRQGPTADLPSNIKYVPHNSTRHTETNWMCWWWRYVSLWRFNTRQTSVRSPFMSRIPSPMICGRQKNSEGAESNPAVVCMFVFLCSRPTVPSSLIWSDTKHLVQ